MALNPAEVLAAYAKYREQEEKEPFIRVNHEKPGNFKSSLVSFDFWTPTGYRMLGPLVFSSIINTNIAAQIKPKYSFQLGAQLSTKYNPGVLTCQVYKLLCDETKKLFPDAIIGYTDAIDGKPLPEPVFRIKLYKDKGTLCRLGDGSFCPYESDFGVSYFKHGNLIKAIVTFGLMKTPNGHYALARAKQFSLYINKNVITGLEIDDDDKNLLDSFEV